MLLLVACLAQNILMFKAHNVNGLFLPPNYYKCNQEVLLSLIEINCNFTIVGAEEFPNRLWLYARFVFNFMLLKCAQDLTLEILVKSFMDNVAICYFTQFTMQMPKFKLKSVTNAINLFSI